MDADQLLEVIGNENRRRILKLLSIKPCYVSEIAYTLKMAPKAVLEHLEKLEQAGLIRCFEEGRRRYYYIDRSIRIEINISPHVFMTRVSDSEARGGLEGNAFRLFREAAKAFDEISKRQNEIFARMTAAIERVMDEIERMFSDNVERAVVASLIKGAETPEEISESFGMPFREVHAVLEKLESMGFVERVKKNGNYVWRLRI